MTELADAIAITLDGKLKRGEVPKIVARNIERVARAYLIDEMTEQFRTLLWDGYARSDHEHYQ